MVEYISGVNGTGKTRTLAQAAIITAQNSNGNVIFVDDTDKLKYELPSNIRLINTEDYMINSSVCLCGFLLGLCASDFDLTDVFVDSTTDIIEESKTNVDDFMEIINRVSEATGVNFHFAVNDKHEDILMYQRVEG